MVMKSDYGELAGKLAAILLLAVFALVVCNVPAVPALRRINHAAAAAQVETYKTFYAYLESEDGTHEICKGLLDEHAKGVAAGEYTEERLKADCAQRVATLEAEFDRALGTCALASGLLDSALDVWTNLEARERRKALEPLMGALGKLLGFLKRAGAPIPSSVTMLLTEFEALRSSMEE